MDVNRENMQKWVDGLLSGAFIQSKGVLKNGDGDCCLGVACEVAAADGVEMEAKYVPDYQRWYFDGRWDALPKSVMDWLGIDNCDPVLETPDGATKQASVWNDNYGWSFEDIAAAITETYLQDT